jgi:DNA-binding NarL/FixJ family response regulator
MDPRGRRGSRLGMPKCILLVDDSTLVLELLKSSLEDIPGWIVVGVAHDGREAIAQVMRLRPDLVILDFAMPVMNGLDTARELARLRPALAVIMFTTFQTPQLEKEALASGCRMVVDKTQVPRLIAAVHDLFADAA